MPGTQESIFIRAMADEAKRSRGAGGGMDGNGAGRGAVFRLSFQSDFTNEMDMWYSNGRTGSNGIHAYAS